jgi:hypothetical protein
MAVKGKRAEKKFSEEVVKEAKEQGVPVEPHPALKADNPAAPPETPKPVRDGQLLASYVLPHYRTDKEGERVIEMEFSFPLTPDHEGQIPAGVEVAWKFMRGKTVPYVGVDGIGDQWITIRKAPDTGEEYLLHLNEASVVKAKVKRTQQKGKGHVKTVILFSFRILVDVSKDNCRFADNNFGDYVWLEMAESQGKLAL